MQPDDAAQLDKSLVSIQSALPSGVLGIYLIGSAVLGGLRPRSDLDLLLVLRAR